MIGLNMALLEIGQALDTLRGIAAVAGVPVAEPDGIPSFPELLNAVRRLGKSHDGRVDPVVCARLVWAGYDAGSSDGSEFERRLSDDQQPGRPNHDWRRWRLQKMLRALTGDSMPTCDDWDDQKMLANVASAKLVDMVSKNEVGMAWLRRVAQTFQKADTDVPWCIGGGALRWLCGWPGQPRDIDVLYFDATGGPQITGLGTWDFSFSGARIPFELTNQTCFGGSLTEGMLSCVLTASTVGVTLRDGQVKAVFAGQDGVCDLVDRAVRYNPWSSQTYEVFHTFCRERGLKEVS